jgi:hypothetical protein
MYVSKAKKVKISNRLSPLGRNPEEIPSFMSLFIIIMLKHYVKCNENLSSTVVRELH